jgi:hypothetical protein
VEERGNRWDLGGYDSDLKDEGWDHDGGRSNDGWTTCGNSPRGIHEQGDDNRYQDDGGWVGPFVTDLPPESAKGALILDDDSAAPSSGWSNAEDASNYNGNNEPTAPAPSKPANKTYTVIYWATVESGDETMHIPIDSNHVSGPEKAILNGPAKKVWMWVQDKGLGNKVSLQDAFDLAKDMQNVD